MRRLVLRRARARARRIWPGLRWARLAVGRLGRVRLAWI